MPTRTLATILGLSLVLSLGDARAAPPSGGGAPPPEHELSIQVGESRQLEFKGLKQIHIGNPKVADVKPMGDDVFTLFGVGTGETLLVVRRADKEPIRFRIIVTDSLKRHTVFLRYADGIALQRLLRNYLSKSGRVDYEDRTRALVIVDEPAVVEVVLRAVAELDQKPLRLGIKLTLVRAETVDKPAPVPAELQPVVKQMKGVVAYNQWSVMDTAFIATEAGKRSRLQVGGAEQLKVDLFPERILGDSKTVRLEFHMQRQDATLIQTSVELKDGELAVLGASRIDGAGSALVTVVAAKID
jgi:hypothetical protein